jgi:hypothetical protein
MYIYGEYSRDSIHAWGLMTNSNYVLGPGTGKQYPLTVQDIYLVEWAIALHGMYESTLVLFQF